MIKENRKNFYFAYRSFWPEFEAMRQFKDAGVNTICIFAANTDNSLGKPYSKYPPVWRWFGKYDFESLDKQYDEALAVNPAAEFICMIDMNSPVWLQRQLAMSGHSSESESFTMLSCACANPEWRSAVCEYVMATVKHMESRYGNCVKAYLLACGHTDEWMDYSRGAAGKNKTLQWKSWLKAHGKPEAPVPEQDSFETASFNGLIRDPATEMVFIDYARFTGDIIADTILEFASKTRQLIPKGREIGMFFGYILELTNSRLVWSGHLEYERLYSSPDIDFFISPGTYSDRLMGGGSGFMAPTGSLKLHGKSFLHEMDHRTPTYNCDLDKYVSFSLMTPWKTQAETDAGLKREFALAIINQTSLWCFDMWGGVFKTPETMRVVAQSKKLWDKYARQPLRSAAEVALIVDPQSARLLNDKNPLIPEIYQGTRNKLNRLGAPFDIFSFSDLPRADLSRYRMFVFPGLFELTQERMEVLKKYALTSGKTAFFVYAPGISNGESLHVARIKELCGAEFGSQGVSSVNMGKWTAVYAARYEDVTPQVLKKAAVDAGVNIYCAEEMPVYSNSRLLAIHSAEGGKIKVTLPREYSKVTELYSGKTVAEEASSFVFEFKAPDTGLFELTE